MSVPTSDIDNKKNETMNDRTVILLQCTLQKFDIVYKTPILELWNEIKLYIDTVYKQFQYHNLIWYHSKD